MTNVRPGSRSAYGRLRKGRKGRILANPATWHAKRVHFVERAESGFELPIDKEGERDGVKRGIYLRPTATSH